jgi:hypothetical protein
MIRRRSLFAVAVLISAFAFTGESAALSNRRISVQFRGPLKDALKRIASEGGINLVVTGNLDQQAEVYLKDVAPEEALKSVASAYHLQLEQQGNIWALRPMGEKAEAVPSPAPPPQAPAAPSPPPAPREQDAVREGQGDEKAQKETEVLEGKDARRKMRELDRKLRHSKFGRKGSGDRIQKGDLVVSEGETINSAVVYGGKLTVNGEITGDAVAIGGAVAINGHVNGDVVAIGGGVHLGSKAVVDGDVTSVGGEIVKEEGAEVGGNQASIADAVLPPILTGGGIHSADLKRVIEDLIHSRVPRPIHEDHMPHSGFLRFLIYFALLFGSGFLFFMFAPARMNQVESEVRSEPLRCGLTGLVGLVALLPLTVLLAITVIGIPFAAFLWIAAVVGIVMGFCAIAHEIGMRLPWFKLRKTQAGVLAVGILVLMLVGIVPILGALTLSFIVLLAFGAVIRTRFGKPRAGLPEPIPAVPA